MSQIIMAGVFKQKLCMRKTWSCGSFRAVTAAKRRTRSFAWSLLQTHFKKSLWLFLPGRIRGLSVLVTWKPLQNDTTKFAKYFPWWAERKEDKSPWARKLLAELCGTDRRELSASPRLDVLGKLPVPACPGSLPYPGYSCQVQGKATPSFSLGMCSVLGIRCYWGSHWCVICSVAHETAILHWFPTPLHEFIINSFIMLFLWEIPDCRPWEVYPGLSL